MEYILGPKKQYTGVMLNMAICMLWYLAKMMAIKLLLMSPAFFRVASGGSSMC